MHINNFITIHGGGRHTARNTGDQRRSQEFASRRQVNADPPVGSRGRAGGICELRFQKLGTNMEVNSTKIYKTYQY